MLRIDDLNFSIAGRPLFAGASANIGPGQKVGLIGRNGSGKTTLLKLILGELHVDGGTIGRPPGMRIGALAQEAPGGEQTALAFVLEADAERGRLLAEIETQHLAAEIDGHAVAEAHDRLAEIAAHSAPARAAAILAGLGFDHAELNRPLGELSGGWRMRAALAAILFAAPDLLLLDEPTNHLDLEASLWLEAYLKRYAGAYIIVSHDRALLNNAVDCVLHVDRRKLDFYRGGYDDFERQRRDRLIRQSALRSRQESERARLTVFVERFRAKASKARQAQSRVKMLARMAPIAAAIEDPTIVFRFPEPEPLPSPLLALDGAAVGYEADRPVLQRLNLRLDMDDRIALLGANGNGKSTFARLLAGRLRTSAGTLTRGRKLKVGYFAQHQLDELDMSATAYRHLAELMPKAREDQVRARLGRFGFTQDKANVAAAQLSGGEKARLLFALMSHAAPHLMILDEPTNHLDVDAREALIQAINDYAGAIVLVSHDRHLLELCADRLWLVADGTVRAFDGDLDDYARLLIERRRAAKPPSPEILARNARRAAVSDANSSAPASVSRRDERRTKALARAAVAPLRAKAKAAEALIEKLHAERAALDAALADGATYAAGPKRAAELAKSRAANERRLGEAEADWLKAQEALAAEQFRGHNT